MHIEWSDRPLTRAGGIATRRGAWLAFIAAALAAAVLLADDPGPAPDDGAAMLQLEDWRGNSARIPPAF